MNDRKERVARAQSKDYDEARLLVRPLESNSYLFFLVVLWVFFSHLVGFHLVAQAAESSEAKTTLALEALEGYGSRRGLSSVPKLSKMFPPNNKNHILF